jgi:hypothetical protein
MLTACDVMLPGNFLQVSTSRSLVAQGIDDNLKGAGPRNRSRVSPALGRPWWLISWRKLYFEKTLSTDTL